MNTSPKTTHEISKFALQQMEAANIRNARFRVAGREDADSQPCMTVDRGSYIEGSLFIAWKAVGSPTEGVTRWSPQVRVNIPAFNNGPLEAVAFLALVQDLAMLAASLQAQLNDFGPAILPAPATERAV